MSQIARKDLVHFLFPRRKRDLKTKVSFMLRSKEKNMNSYDRTNWTSDYFIMFFRDSYEYSCQVYSTHFSDFLSLMGLFL